ncbi:hypothetical protein BJ973_005818 [Actinoplanes tereljensis]|uniref:Lipoprotein n=1 Tax=Paractinoplanes tereljensis TaxID=571912 RepID=A0A919P036_9ACTN|nr:hypothetical protein [Actinoplanes tereljensis]GIF26457.1 hypothetical protein Ate02nite_91870 [Actinoplanes tereljensis]
MLTRRATAGLALLLCLAGCANQTSSASDSPASSVSSPVPATSAASPSEPGVPTATGAQTITGTVEAGVEPNCLLLQDGKGSHLLVFDDSAMRADVGVGKKFTLTGRSEPGMMSTCQQGIPFIVTSVTPAS